MAAHTIVFLALAGIVGGIVNAIAGGATLITFPTMLYAGLPPIIANASNAVAILPGHLFAAIADRRRLPPLDGRTKIFLAVAALGVLSARSFCSSCRRKTSSSPRLR